MLASGLALFLSGSRGVGADEPSIATLDHFVSHVSTVPAIAGQPVQLYVRERVLADNATVITPLTGKVVLFVHGAGTPAEVSFDVPYADYSWMAYLAEAGLDTFSMDTTGYGPSTRPPAMDDPCNLRPAQQAELGESCPPTYERQLTTIASDWDDVAAVVEYVRTLRHVDKINLVGWSLGGLRAGGFAAAHPDLVDSLVLLAPAVYAADGRGEPPADVPAPGVAFSIQSRAAFDANWNRQVGCADQYAPDTANAVWTSMLESDPVGATWGPGVRRAPLVTTWGWNTSRVASWHAPTLLVSGEHDMQANPQSVRQLYNDLGTNHKVFVDLACSSHNAVWEMNHHVLFDASLEWLTQGTVKGNREGMLRLGD